MAKRGMSLVEVLVVLVVLVIGIFGVALLFPSGFGSIRFTEHTTTAQSLARANEEYFRARAANLTEAGAMTCHSMIWTNAEMLQPVRDSWNQDKPLTT